MSEEYTPDRSVVALRYRFYAEDNGVEFHEGEFERWLADELARAWDEGFEAGERDVMQHESWDEPCIENPYRKEQS